MTMTNPTTPTPTAADDAPLPIVDDARGLEQQITCDHTYLVDGDVCLILEYLGHGLKHDEYDPDDPDDRPMLSLRGCRKVGTTNAETGRLVYQWEVITKGSYTTYLAATEPREVQEAALRFLMGRLHYVVRCGFGGPLFAELSCINRDWIDRPTHTHAVGGEPRGWWPEDDTGTGSRGTRGKRAAAATKKDVPTGDCGPSCATPAVTDAVGSITTGTPTVALVGPVPGGPVLTAPEGSRGPAEPTVTTPEALADIYRDTYGVEGYLG